MTATSVSSKLTKTLEHKFVFVSLCYDTQIKRSQCSKPHFEGNVVLSDKDISTNDFPDGSQVTFMCIRGYVPVVTGTSKLVTCNGNKWTELALSCTRKSCGSLPEFPNGRYIIPNGILFGDSVTGVCDKGYMSMSFGTNQRTCRAEGWDGRAPECEAVTCPSPRVIDNGRFDGQEDTDRQYEYEDGVSYRCNSGFYLIGSAVLRCSDDGAFQPEPPKCIVVSCLAPNVPNGYRAGGKAPPYTLNNFIDYKCSNGYDMIGEYSIRCTANGWSPEPPRCIGYCEPPVFEGHVTISKASDLNQKYHEGTSVTFECKSGYKPVDSEASNTAICEGKRWTALKLTCKGEYCEPPAFGGPFTISKPFDSMTKFLDGSSVTFECKSGYEPVDSEASKLVTCVDTKWTDLQLTCKGYCGPPVFEGHVIAKQLNSINKFLDGSHLEFECKSGYKPVDSKASKLVTCKDTKWTDLQLTCTDSDSNSTPSSGLSPGAIFGIVSLFVAVVVIPAVIVFFIKKNKSDKNPSRSP
ncbi:membrane-bound complement regulatory protein [Triplophysa rosa]|uniref:Membrane-bound complement regulatory protein n=1 Tax=Triplophysa rosa TaxID=992332 RepID=A0A9W7WBN8_TRIRA|nr:membrane-bound complement regulatory protein [Triplophysa rosa]